MTAFRIPLSFSLPNHRQLLYIMKQRTSLSETLQNLTSQGYRLVADLLAEFPEQSIRSDDWRLDSVEQVRQENGNTLVIAVSSTSRRMKLVFVEMLTSITEFSPITLLRQLFPMQQRTDVQWSVLRTH